MTKLLVIICFIMLCFNSCIEQSAEKAFLAKYEFEDFSQFKNVSIFIRSVDSERNPIIFITAPHLISDTSDIRCYFVKLNRKSHQIIEAHWMAEHHVEADALKLQQLALTFIKYRVPRLKVDTIGNVFVYMRDVETLALVRFVNKKELQKQDKEIKWVEIGHNWYKPR